MGFAETYIAKQTNSFPVIPVLPEKGVNLIVVIPCYNEPDLPDTLRSLAGCMPPEGLVEVVVVINSPENSSQEIIAQNNQTEQWITANKHLFPEWIRVYTIKADNLKRKWAGVGWARKIGMDEAVRRFSVLEKPEGVIVSLDSDTLVAPNYFSAIEEHFKKFPLHNFATLRFEHFYSKPDIEPYLAYGIVAYELYMRYYRHALSWAGYPHAIYTVGSAFAVRADAYVKQGGMNRKKGGEDFYFLQKLVPLGDYGEIKETCVYPSCRLSNRVPFGTGPMLQSWINGEKDLTLAYHFQAFRELKQFLDQVEALYKISSSDFYALINQLSPGIRNFLFASTGFYDSLAELSANCSDLSVFNKRFWHFFNAFTILKYLNYVHERYFELVPLAGSVFLLLSETGVVQNEMVQGDLSLYLSIFRKIDRELGK